MATIFLLTKQRLVEQHQHFFFQNLNPFETIVHSMAHSFLVSRACQMETKNPPSVARFASPAAEKKVRTYSYCLGGGGHQDGDENIFLKRKNAERPDLTFDRRRHKSPATPPTPAAARATDVRLTDNRTSTTHFL